MEFEKGTCKYIQSTDQWYSERVIFINLPLLNFSDRVDNTEYILV